MIVNNNNTAEGFILKNSAPTFEILSHSVEHN